MNILVTGGAGYIGSHTTIELLEEGYNVIIIDNLSNSSKDMISRIENITQKKVITYFLDLLDVEGIKQVFDNHQIDSVIHFAAYKAVSESVEDPLKYYENNVVGTLNLCKVMEEHKIYNMIFSSSATVYGIPRKLPITEDSPANAINPYGQTKLICENMLRDLSQSNELWNIALLRYFNPVGAHPSGEIGERPNGVPSNLMPYITQVAIGNLDYVKVFGNDYPTQDGTGIRDYIHVVDLAKGHIAALKNIEFLHGIEEFNLGTGKGYSVFEVIKTFEKASGIRIPYKILERRSGDAAVSYADPTKINEQLSWFASRTLYDMCKDAWNWESSQLIKVR